MLENGMALIYTAAAEANVEADGIAGAFWGTPA
jgi:hypothetical protein